MLDRRKFLTLIGAASLTTLLGGTLAGCASEEDNKLTKTEDTKYYNIGEHHFYIEISTETNGEAKYYEENIKQTEGSTVKANFIPVKGGTAGRGAHSSIRISKTIPKTSPKIGSSKGNNSNSRYYGNSSSSIFNDFTSGLLLGMIIINGTTMLYGNTDAKNSESINIDIPEGYEVTNTEELKNEDVIYGYKIHMENNVPVEVFGYSDENGNITYPYPGSVAKVKSQNSSYVKTLSKRYMAV